MQSEFLECKPCGKKFTGRECLEQHLASAKHLKKMAIMGNQPLQPQSISQGQCSSLGEVSSSGITESVDSAHRVRVETSRILSNQASKTVTNNLICDCCKLSFSTVDEYLCHMKSEKHFDVLRQSLLNSIQPNDVACGQRNEISPVASSPCAMQAGNQSMMESPFKCSICDVICSGEEPYKAHLAGKIHKKKLALKEREAAHLPLGTIINDQVLSKMMFCEICNISCSGIVPFEMHQNGEKHRKELAKRGLAKSQAPLPINMKSNATSLSDKSQEIPCISLVSSDESSDGEGDERAMDWKSNFPPSLSSGAGSAGGVCGIRDIMYSSDQKYDEMLKKLKEHEVDLITIDDPVVF